MPETSRRKFAWICGAALPPLTCILGSLLLWRWLPFPLGTGCGLTLLVMLGVVVVTDSSWKKIPNWATYPVFVWMVAFNGLGSFLASSSNTESTVQALHGWAVVGPPGLGAIGIGPSLLGALVCFAVMVVLSGWLRSAGGDVKLLTVIGACVGVRYGLLALCLGYILAGSYSLLLCVWHYGALNMIKGFFAWVGNFLFPFMVAKPQVSDDQLLKSGVPLGAHFALGTIIAVTRVIPGLTL